MTAKDAIRRLREISGGNFLWTEQALLSLANGTHSFARLDTLSPGLTGLYVAFFERQFPDAASYAPARLVLEVVAAAREPLTTDQLAGATGVDPDYELPALLDQLAVYLPDRDGRRAVHHKSLADWLTGTTEPRPAGRFFASPRRGHERLAAWCWAAYQGGVERMPAYSLRHLPAHLIEAARWDDLAAVLRDPPYLEARAEAGQVFDLAMDFTRTGERLPVDHPARRPLRLIEQALRSDLHFLARHPTALFACVWNRCWWYDCPEAAVHYDPPHGGWPAEGPPWARPAPERLATWLESWRGAKERATPRYPWLRSLWPPPFPFGGAELACLRGHTNWVNSVAFDPDGRRVVTGTGDQTAQVWDAQTGDELACLRGHTNWVNSVAFDPDGRRVVTGSDDQTARIWDARSGECLEVIQGSGEVQAIAATGTGFRWRALNREQETVVEPVAGGAPVAWFPAALGHLSSHPSGRAWAGSQGYDVYLIQLEGEPGRQ
jgi:hypothetical protein